MRRPLLPSGFDLLGKVTNFVIKDAVVARPQIPTGQIQRAFGAFGVASFEQGFGGDLIRKIPPLFRPRRPNKLRYSFIAASI